MTTGALTEADLSTAAATLAQRDPLLASILQQHGPPPLWARKPGFDTLVHIILEQQVSLASAASMFARLKQKTVPFQPARITELGETHLKSLGLTRQKTAYCLDLSRALTEKSLKLSQLSRMSDEDVRTSLMQIKGIGRWSADIYLLMVLLRPDVWPANDLALAVAIKNLMQLKQRPSPVQLQAMAEAWRPFRSVAARMLWQYYLANQKASRDGRAKRSNSKEKGLPG
jgi:DNA-3-methyladenine glycosylase II